MTAAQRMHRAEGHFDSGVISWMARNSVLLTRVALGLIFLWFGLMKFFFPQGESEQLASRTIASLTFGLIKPSASLPLLGAWECIVGLGLLSGRFLRTTIVLLLLQMPGTFTPLLLFRSETWVHFPYEPTLTGQYILKNIVLICAGLLVGGTMCGGKVTANRTVVSDMKTP